MRMYNILATYHEFSIFSDLYDLHRCCLWKAHPMGICLPIYSYFPYTTHKLIDYFISIIIYSVIIIRYFRENT